MYYSSLFSSKLTLVLVSYATTNHLVIIYMRTSHFFQMPLRIVACIVAKMIDFDINHKCVGWNGQ
jgi:hypothetical protein